MTTATWIRDHCLAPGRAVDARLIWRLGCERYVSQRGDWGAIVSEVKAVHAFCHAAIREPRPSQAGGSSAARQPGSPLPPTGRISICSGMPSNSGIACSTNGRSSGAFSASACAS
jgi:hypothetical protein